MNRSAPARQVGCGYDLPEKSAIRSFVRIVLTNDMTEICLKILPLTFYNQSRVRILPIKDRCKIYVINEILTIRNTQSSIQVCYNGLPYRRCRRAYPLLRGARRHGQHTITEGAGKSMILKRAGDITW